MDIKVVDLWSKGNEGLLECTVTGPDNFKESYQIVAIRGSEGWSQSRYVPGSLTKDECRTLGEMWAEKEEGWKVMVFPSADEIKEWIKEGNDNGDKSDS